MNILWRIPIYLGYVVAILGFAAHFTGIQLLALMPADAGMSSAFAGMLLSVSYLYVYKAYQSQKAERLGEEDA